MGFYKNIATGNMGGRQSTPPVQMKLSVVGIQKLQVLFDKVPKELKMVTFKRAFTKGADILQKQALSNLPPSKRKRAQVTRARVYRYGRTAKIRLQEEGGGTLRKALTGKHGRLWKKNGSNGLPELFVGPSWRKNARPYNAWYAHFVEYGTKKIRGHHFMERAYSSTSDSVFNAIEGQMIKDIKKIFQ